MNTFILGELIGVEYLFDQTGKTMGLTLEDGGDEDDAIEGVDELNEDPTHLEKVKYTIYYCYSDTTEK